VGARDRQHPPRGRDLAEQVGPRPVGQPALARGDTLGIVGRDRGRVHDLDVVARGHVGGRVADDRLDPGLLEQALGIGRPGAVRARDLRTEGVRGQRVGAHARPAHADEVQAPAVPAHHRRLV
jgi:hypothetical protein